MLDGVVAVGSRSELVFMLGSLRISYSFHWTIEWLCDMKRTIQG